MSFRSFPSICAAWAYSGDKHAFLKTMANAMRKRNTSAVRQRGGYCCFISKTPRVFCASMCMYATCSWGATHTKQPGYQKLLGDERILEGEIKANSTHHCKNSTQNSNILFTQLQQWVCQESKKAGHLPCMNNVC